MARVRTHLFNSSLFSAGVFIVVSTVRLFARDTPLGGDVIVASAVLTEHFVEHVEVSKSDRLSCRSIPWNSLQ
jgi:hypothetical protein